VPIATIASAGLRARTTGCTKPLSIMAIEASRPNAGVMNYAKRGSTAGAPVIDGGMKTHIAGTRNAIGMTMITTATTTESCSLMSGSGMHSRSQPMSYLITCPSTSVPEAV
jgi:hypothetical protein